jgi:hypothetical protein
MFEVWIGRSEGQKQGTRALESREHHGANNLKNEDDFT